MVSVDFGRPIRLSDLSVSDLTATCATLVINFTTFDVLVGFSQNGIEQLPMSLLRAGL